MYEHIRELHPKWYNMSENVGLCSVLQAGQMIKISLGFDVGRGLRPVHFMTGPVTILSRFSVGPAH